MSRMRAWRIVLFAWVAVAGFGGVARAGVGELLWVQGDDTLRRVDPASRFQDTVLQWPDIDGPAAAAVDRATGRVYWAQSFSDRIISADATGADERMLTEWPTSDNVVAIAVDSAAGKIYWAQTLLLDDQILRADLDGQNVEPLVVWPDVDGPITITLDVAGGKLYWAQTFDDKIMQANLDGTLVSAVAQWPEVDEAVALAYDAVGARLFWAQRALQNDQIRVIDLLGGPVQTVVSWPNVDRPVALAVSADGADLYWARSVPNADRIRRSDTSGLNVTTILAWPEVADPRALVLTEPTGCSAPSVTPLGPRYFSAEVAPGALPVALRVEGDPNSPNAACVAGYVQGDGSLGATPVFAPAASWGTVAVFGGNVIPGARYVVRAVCGSALSSAPSSPRGMTTWLRGDTDNNLAVNFVDISRTVSGFLGDFGTGNPPLTLEMADLAPATSLGCGVDGTVNFRDIALVVAAFLQDPDPCLLICP